MIDCQKCGAPNRRRSSACWHCGEEVSDPLNRYGIHQFLHSRFIDVFLYVSTFLGLACFVGSILVMFKAAGQSSPETVGSAMGVAVASLAISAACYRAQE